MSDRIHYEFHGADGGWHKVVVHGKVVYQTRDRRDCDLFIAELRLKNKSDEELASCRAQLAAEKEAHERTKAELADAHQAALDAIERMGKACYAEGRMEGERDGLKIHVSSLTAELERYKKAAQLIFNDPVAYMENKSVMWKDRAEKAESALAELQGKWELNSTRFRQTEQTYAVFKQDYDELKAELAELRERVEGAATGTVTRFSNCVAVGGLQDKDWDHLQLGQSVPVALVVRKRTDPRTEGDT